MARIRFLLLFVALASFGVIYNRYSQETSTTESKSMYQKGQNFWKSVDATENGMLGGFTNLAKPDESDSKALLEILFSEKNVSKHRALDCGSGIGRVTKNVLLHHFDTVDMVDVTENFLDASAVYLDKLNSRIGEKFCSGLQDFVPKENYYDTIWIQWVSGHLTDEHYIRFLKRCKAGLTENGVIIVKENIAIFELTDYDGEDHSWTRPRSLLLRLFKESVLKVIKDRKQSDWPVGMYPVEMNYRSDHSIDTQHSISLTYFRTTLLLRRKMTNGFNPASVHVICEPMTSNPEVLQIQSKKICNIENNCAKYQYQKWDSYGKSGY